MKKRLIVVLSVCFIMLCSLVIYKNLGNIPPFPQADSTLRGNVLPTTTSVFYSVKGPAVAPKYHRDYEIIFRQDSAVLSIVNCDSLLIRKSYKLDQGGYNSFLEGLRGIELKLGRVSGGSLAGGSTVHLSLYSTDSCYWSGDNYGNVRGELCGDIDGLRNYTESFVKDLDELLATPDPRFE